MLSARQTHIYFICLFFCCLSGCGTTPKPVEYSIGVDPSWYLLQLDGKENQVTAFSTELLQQIGQKENLLITKVSVSWNTLIDGLKKGSYAAILSSMPPYNFNQAAFDFSDIYLPTGPVLVIATTTPFVSLEHMSGKEIAVTPDSAGTQILEKYPGILIRNYDSIAKALNDVNAGVVDGALIDILIATAYCIDLYQGQLQMVTPPLNQAGLRLITLHNQNSHLIDAFNNGLESLKSSQEYDTLLQKWDLLKK